MAVRVIRKGVVREKSASLIAGVRRCANGDLLVAFNTGGDLSPGQRCGVVRSRDGGRTWGEPETWFESVFRTGGIEAGCSLSRLSSGRLLLPYADGFYLHRDSIDWQKGTGDFSRNALLVCPCSDDNGKSWSNRAAQSYEGFEAFAFGTVVELPDGTLLLPLWGSYETRGKWRPAVLTSRDAGESWGGYRPIAESGNETPIVLLPDGRIMALIRGFTEESGSPFHVAYSEDGGDTWTAPRKIPVNGTSPSLHLSPAGTLLAGYRSTLPGGICRVSSSADGGLTWKLELELALPHGSWKLGGYPVFENLADGTMICVFHNGLPAWHVAYNVLAED